MNPYLKIMRPVSSIMAGLSAVTGLILSGAQFSVLYWYVFLAVFLISGAGMTINDYYDLKIDKINAPQRPLPSGRISPQNALLYTVFLFLTGIFFSALLNIYCFLLALFNSLVEFFYSRNFKGSFLIGNILIAYLAASTFIFGALITFDFKIVTIIALLTFLTTLGREIFKSIEDVKGDRKMALETLPLVSGIKAAEKIAQGSIAAAILLSPLPYLLGLLSESYLKIISIAVIIFFYSIFQKPKKATSFTKVAMFVALLAFLAGKFF